MRRALYLLLLLLIIFRITSFSYNYPEGKIIRIKGRVLVEPIVYDTTRFVKVNGLSMYTDLFPEITYGDVVTVEGLVSKDRLKNAKIVAVKEGGGLYETRQKILWVYKKALPEPHASLVAGIVLGSKAGMPGYFWESLKGTGTAHVVVASGMNVTFVTSFLLNSLVNFVNRKRAVVLALSGAWVYVVLSGFDAPLVRAAIMGGVAFGAQGLGRVSAALHALLVSAALMIIVKPEWAHDIGFLLSFTATLSLILFESKVSSLLTSVPFLFKKDLATTLAAQIGVTPILLFAFGSVNILSPLINSVILWTTPPIMIIGAVAAFAGLLLPAIGQLIILLAYPFTWWFIGVVNLLS